MKHFNPNNYLTITWWFYVLFFLPIQKMSLFSSLEQYQDQEANKTRAQSHQCGEPVYFKKKCGPMWHLTFTVMHVMSQQFNIKKNDGTCKRSLVFTINKVSHQPIF